MLRRALALILGLAVGLALAETVLRLAGLPRFHGAHTPASQFDFLHSRSGSTVFFVNKRNEAITFTYDSDPRGYFGPGSQVVHQTNGNGFRGPDCALAKPPGTFRIVFLGDSFTFGEGVRFEDTFAQRTSALLAQRFRGAGLAFESCNLGVSGYNTADELFLFNALVPRLDPDALVVGYVINDAEPPLFALDPVRGPVRRPRETEIAEGVASPTPPDVGLYRLRVAQLVWQFVAERRRGAATDDYYVSLYRPESAGWAAARDALDQLVATCRRENLPLLVMLFPILHALDDGHPFLDVYGVVQRQVEGSGGQFLNLFPAFAGQDAESLWVHPTDQHPNEIAHRIAAEQLAARLAPVAQGAASNR
ncbi:MAG: SGNH/GDSL hydrolase family protein [Myxococcota bacterium]